MLFFLGLLDRYIQQCNDIPGLISRILKRGILSDWRNQLCFTMEYSQPKCLILFEDRAYTINNSCIAKCTGDIR